MVFCLNMFPLPVMKWRPVNCDPGQEQAEDDDKPISCPSPPVLKLLHCFLIPLLVHSAPAGLLSDLPPAFRDASDRAKVLVEKILKDIPGVHSSTVHTEVKEHVRPAGSTGGLLDALFTQTFVSAAEFDP